MGGGSGGGGYFNEYLNNCIFATCSKACCFSTNKVEKRRI